MGIACYVGCQVLYYLGRVETSWGCGTGGEHSRKSRREGGGETREEGGGGVGYGYGYETHDDRIDRSVSIILGKWKTEAQSTAKPGFSGAILRRLAITMRKRGSLAVRFLMGPAQRLCCGGP